MQEAFGFLPVDVVGALDEIAHVREKIRRMGIPCIERRAPYRGFHARVGHSVRDQIAAGAKWVGGPGCPPTDGATGERGGIEHLPPSLHAPHLRVRQGLHRLSRNAIETEDPVPLGQGARRDGRPDCGRYRGFQGLERRPDALR